MRNLHFYKLWPSLGVIYIGAIFYFCLIPMPSEGPSVHYLDKIVHFSCYAVLGAWFAQLLQKKFLWISCLSFTLMGILIEYLQRWGGYREFEYLDMLANAIGVVIGTTISTKLMPDCLYHIDQKLMGRWIK